MKITKRQGGRTTIHSAICKDETIYVDKLMLKSIKQNQILFRGLRDFYSPFGWIMLTKYYASLAWTCEREFRYFGIDRQTMNDIYKYVDETCSPFYVHRLTSKDERMFNICSNVLFTYLEKLYRMTRNIEDTIYITQLIDN